MTPWDGRREVELSEYRCAASNDPPGRLHASCESQPCAKRKKYRQISPGHPAGEAQDGRAPEMSSMDRRQTYAQVLPNPHVERLEDQEATLGDRKVCERARRMQISADHRTSLISYEQGKNF